MSTSEILSSWTENASNWIDVIQTNGIGSRQVTNPAIIEAVKLLCPSSTLDLGCGEGWLTRALNASSIDTVGVDGTSSLIAWACQQSDHVYQCISFDQIIDGHRIDSGPFEAVVLNFCLYENEKTEHLLQVIQNHMVQRRLLIIQTLHPLSLMSEIFMYKNQWLEDSWKGLPATFSSPHQWYFRTLEGWLETFSKSGLSLLSIKEPKAAKSSKPSSIIYTLTASNA